jgi:hypothetical protein
MSLYTRLVSEAEATADTRALARALTEWHDTMVLHRRHVERAGPREACSAECPHAVAAELWKEARRVLGPAAERLAFLRECAEALRPVA